jgi:hypothetical protein
MRRGLAAGCMSVEAGWVEGAFGAKLRAGRCNDAVRYASSALAGATRPSMIDKVVAAGADAVIGAFQASAVSRTIGCAMSAKRAAGPLTLRIKPDRSIVLHSKGA